MTPRGEAAEVTDDEIGRVVDRRRDLDHPRIREVLLAEHLAADDHRDDHQPERQQRGDLARDGPPEQSNRRRAAAPCARAGSTRRSPGRARSPSPRSRDRPRARRRSVAACSALYTLSPRPGYPTLAAITMMPKAIMIVWFTPSMIDGLASGSWTWRRICRFVDAEGLAGLDRVLGHVPDAEAREPDRRRQREDDRGDHRRGRADAEQQHDGDQIRERRDRLHRVQHGPQRAFEHRDVGRTGCRPGSRSRARR